MQRTPVVILASYQIPLAYPGTPVHTNTSGGTETLSSVTLNNSSGAAVTVTIALTPAAAAPTAADELVTVTVPAAGSAPTPLPALIGQHLAAGQSIQMKASTAAVVTARISGYLTTL